MLELRSLPSSCFGGTKDRFNYGHVAKSVLDGDRNFAVSADGARKNVALNGVLIARGESFGGEAAPENVAAVVDENPARAVIWRVKGYFDFDSAFCAKKLHSLVGNQLRAARENTLARGKIEDDGGQTIGIEFGIAFHEANDSRWFFGKDEARRGDGIAPDVVHASAAPVEDVSDIRRVAIEIAEDSNDRAQVSDSAGAN